MNKIIISDDTITVGLVENVYTIANLEEAVNVVVSNGSEEGGSTVEPQYDTEIDMSVAGTTYVGQAPTGSSAAAPVWRIKKITETANGSSVNWANGSAEFTNIWNNRLSLTYGP